MSRSMFVTALGAVIAGALTLTGCGIADAMNPSNVLSSDHHEASSAVGRNGSSVSEAASDDDTSSLPTNGFGYYIPSFCGKKSTYMLTSSGEVYQLFLPDDMNMNSSGINTLTDDPSKPVEQSTAYCMIPLPYLPAGVDTTSGRPKRHMIVSTNSDGSADGKSENDNYEANYDGLGAGKDGSLFAVSNKFGNPNLGSTAGGSSSFSQPNYAQVYYLSAATRAQYAADPNPRPSDGSTHSHWVTIGGPIDLSSQKEYVSGGAVSPDGIYYLMAVHHKENSNDHDYIDFWKTNSATDPTSMIHAGRLVLSEGNDGGASMAPLDADGDMEFINGDLVVYLSWIRGSSRIIRSEVDPIERTLLGGCFYRM